MLGEEILIEIDSTLDRLIRNAEVVQDASIEDLSETEIEAFKKTQESLLQHLIHLDQTFEKKGNTYHKRSARFKIQEKLLKFEKMKRSYHQTLSNTDRRTSILSKRRSKKVLIRC